jgi:single-strand DNA-binding protein
MSYQQIIVVGNVGRDPEFKYLPSGTPTAQFTLASNERWNDKQTNETKEKTTWFRVSVYGPQAQTVNEYVRKGRQVMVIGTVEGRAYLDNNNQPAMSLELRARDVRFLGGRSEGGVGGQQGGDEYNSGYGDSSKNMDDVPF